MVNSENNINKSSNLTQLQNTASQAEAKKLWQEYSRKKQHKNLKKTLILTCVLFLLAVFVIIGLYIILSTTDPTHSK